VTSPAKFLLFVRLAVVGVKLSEQLYGVVAHRQERALARELRGRLLDSGAEVVARRAEADSLKRVLEGEDRRLEREHRRVRWFHRSADRGLLDPEEYARYADEVTRYNRHVAERNAVLRELEASFARLSAANGRYVGLADSIHGLAVRMNQPYYQVPSALEAADERRRALP
jgi:predicted RNase H-like nuclease (RuvC/YqgF family)